MGLTVMLVLACGGVSRLLAEELTISLLKESSPLWPGRTCVGGWIADTNDPTGPFYSQAVSFRGRSQGGSTDRRGEAYLVYRYLIEFSEDVRLNAIRVSGSAFNGTGSVIRLLDKDSKEIRVVATQGGNSYRSFTINGSVTGRRFYLDEYDGSSEWRYRERIMLEYERLSGDPCSYDPLGGCDRYGRQLPEDGVVRAMPGTSATMPVSENAHPWYPDTDNPLGVFCNQSVIFRGWTSRGGSLEQREGAYLVYRYLLDFGKVVRLNFVTVCGSGFNGPNSVIRLLDENRKERALVETYGGDSYQSHLLSAQVIGRRFYLEEYDTSGLWRFREKIVVDYDEAAGDVNGDALCNSLDLATLSGEWLVESWPRIVAMPGTCQAWPLHTLFLGPQAQTTSPLGPFSGQAVTFHGCSFDGNSEMRGDAGLVYRYLIEFQEPTRIESVRVSGAGFRAGDSVIRLLDEDMHLLSQVATSGGNTAQVFTLGATRARGQRFYLDEFESSTTWRYRDRIEVRYTGSQGQILQADLNSDNIIDFYDYALLASGLTAE